MITKLLLGRYLREKSLIEIERRTGIPLKRLIAIDSGNQKPTTEEGQSIAKAVGFRVEEVFPDGD